ncbi:MAG: histone deacetylase family protein, partial [Acidobacteriota bacterium]
GCQAIFFECLPDEPEQASQAVAAANVARLKFYERWGARPMIGTAYETPVSPEDADAPHLVVDTLDSDQLPSRSWTRKVVQAILERKYAHLCTPEYNRMVVNSFKDDPIRLRPFRYTKEGLPHPPPEPRTEPILLTINDRHEIHHIRERGYVEAPARISKILEAVESTGWFEIRTPKEYPLRHITDVHDPALVSYLRRASEEVGEERSLYPYVFPIRNKARLPKERSVLAGYFCIDTFTPIHHNVFRAAKRAVDCTLMAAEELLEGRRLAYSLVRPPGHHAERTSFGGFCYFNNAAVAAHLLSKYGKVAILDVDYHHGNGQQDIFYSRADVLTISIHGHPRFAYPYFSGFEDEVGEGAGQGFNLNIPLPEKLDGKGHRAALRKALERVRGFDPAFLIISLGLDPAKGDPTGTWTLATDDFRRNGDLVGELGLPTLIVQEGGYRTRTLGANARAFFQGLQESAPR